MNGDGPVRLPTQFIEKKEWGSADLAPWFPRPQNKIGEVWFKADLPILVKFLFTTEPLSIQVHPDDSFARVHENSPGKTEMWYVLRADPGAQLGLGFREPITREQLRNAAGTQEMMSLLQWVSVEAGNVFFVRAGTVHAIGAGLALCEIQQHSDVTYRLYDYGRPRELHLEKALQVASTEAYDARPVILPVDSKYFHVELDMTASQLQYKPAPDRFHLLIFLAGRGTIGDQEFLEGQTWLVPARGAAFFIRPIDPVRFLRVWVP